MMIISGSMLLCSSILALACSIVVAPSLEINIPGINSLDPSIDQDVHKAAHLQSTHRYTPFSMWNACGVIPYDGYDGWVNQEGQAWKCDDGIMVYFVNDGYTSPRAAEAERIARLKKKSPEGKPWRIAQTESLGDITVVELADPVQVSIEKDSLNQWGVMRVRGASLITIYGPDREHVLDYYQAHAKGNTKK